MEYGVEAIAELAELAASSELYWSAMASASSSLTPGGFTMPAPRPLRPPPLATVVAVEDAVAAEAEGALPLKGPMLLALAADEDRAMAANLQRGQMDRWGQFTI